jgi:2-desacetyl-2-hydroxyethyl bacteriochlorophyllide A dehydrogenase
LSRALWFVGPRRAELRDERVADPEPDEVQVAAICSLVSAGSEMNLYRGEGNLPDKLLPTARGEIPFPLSFGYQEIGEVVVAGAESGFAVGDRALCMHPHQDLFTTKAAFVSKVPDDIGSERAAFSLMGVALNAVHSTPIRVGEYVAVSGLGLVGSMVAYLARKVAGRLIVIDPSESRRKLAQWTGADAIVDPVDAAAAADEVTGGRGIDLYFEASGAPAALQTAIQLTAMEGTISVSSWYGTRRAELLLSPEFHLRRQHIVSTGPSQPPDLVPRWDHQRLAEARWDLLREVPLEDHLITHRVPFARAPEAYELLDTPRSDALAVLLEHAK